MKRWGNGPTRNRLSRCNASREKRVASDKTVPVWFNAWRYEKEEHLIVPLLDTLRDDLLTWGKKHGAEDRAREAAKGIGRAARALVAGLSLTVGVPSVKFGFDGGQALEEFRRKPPERATSFYFASFTELQATLEKFFKGEEGRVVVFIDDLDRCLPQSALEVLMRDRATLRQVVAELPPDAQAFQLLFVGRMLELAVR